MSYNTDANNSKANYTRVKSENRSKMDIAVRNLRIAPGEHQAYISVKRDKISISIILATIHTTHYTLHTKH